MMQLTLTLKVITVQLSKRHLLSTTVLFTTTINRTIMFHLPMKLLLGSNLSQREKQRENKLVGENNYSFKAVPLITFNLLRIE